MLASAASSAIVPAWITRPLSITLTVSPISCATRKFCSTSRIVAPRRFTSFRQSISAPMIAGASPLVGSSISSSLRGSMKARAKREHLLLPAGQRSGARQPELLQRREEAENPVETRLVHRSLARRKHEVLAHREVGEHRHGLRHIADAGARDVGRGKRLDALAAEADFAARGAPQSHDGAQRRGLAGAVAAEQHRGAAFGHAELDAVQDVIAPDMRLDAREGEKLAHAAFSPKLPR